MTLPARSILANAIHWLLIRSTNTPTVSDRQAVTILNQLRHA